MSEKLILDACCGSRMFWFDKSNPNALYVDIRNEDIKIINGHTVSVRPDMEVDFRNMPFPDNSFKLVVFDPPHITNLKPTAFMAAKYGSLSFDWRIDIKQGFDECMRVLKLHGILIFKWNEARIKLNEVLKAIQVEPLFGHVTGKHGRTIWLAFMKGI